MALRRETAAEVLEIAAEAKTEESTTRGTSGTEEI